MKRSFPAIMERVTRPLLRSKMLSFNLTIASCPFSTAHDSGVQSVLSFESASTSCFEDQTKLNALFENPVRICYAYIKADFRQSTHLANCSHASHLDYIQAHAPPLYSSRG